MKKNIGAIISLAVIGALIVATIIMALVPYDFMMNIAKPDAIIVYQNGSSYTYYHSTASEKTEFDEIYSRLVKGYKTSAINALFDGNLGKKATIVDKSSSVSLSSGVKIVFDYNTTQILKDGKSNYKGDIEYTRLVFEISDTDDFINQKAYVIYSNSSANYPSYRQYYETPSNFADLYDYLTA